MSNDRAGPLHRTRVPRPRLCGSSASAPRAVQTTLDGGSVLPGLRYATRSRPDGHRGPTVRTVVNSDLKGSTALGEQLDPESLREVLTRYFDEMRFVYERYGGTIEKIIGDAIVAVFGVPTPRDRRCDPCRRGSRP